MRQLGVIVLCFLAGILGSMVGSDLTDNSGSEPRGVYPSSMVALTANTVAPGAVDSKSSNPVIAAVRKVGPAVVNIDTVVMKRASMFGFSDPFGDLFGGDPFSQLVPSQGQGSGFVIDSAKGYVLTNAHVVGDAVANKGKIKVSLPNRDTFDATVVGSDTQYDVAVLKIDGKNLPSVTLSDSDDLVIGEPALAIGNPFGFRNTVTVGVISAVDRSLDTGDGGRLEGLIQTDAAINPGNSGGPLCDVDGRVVGINTAIIRGAEGMGFAIGASSIKPVVEEIIKFGRVKHGWSGMEFWDISRRVANRLGLAGTEGALVYEVYESGPAAEANIKPGDVITAANSGKITSVADIKGVLRKARPGDNLSLTLIRRGKTANVKITLAEVPESLRGR